MTTTTKSLGSILITLIFSAATFFGGDAQPGKVVLLRTPGSGIQPQVAVDDKGILHLIYFSGPDGGGDVFYVRSENGGTTFSKPLRVNSQPGSAIATGNIHGAHLAIGKNGRVHVAWMGSNKADRTTPANAIPMLYARLKDDGTVFEDQRNVIRTAFGLDGGGSIAADDQGHVYVAWHAPLPGIKGEENRRVWLAQSHDEGKSFSPEKAISEPGTGACGCCGMRALVSRNGTLYMLYRSARAGIHRDTYLLTSVNHGDTFKSADLHPWNVATCPMSSFALAQSNKDILAAWETDGQVYFCRIDSTSGIASEPRAMPGRGKDKKHPVVASNSQGETIVAWTEGMGWNRGGSVAWQVFDKDESPTGETGRAAGVPSWSLVAVFARPNGRFSIAY